MGLYTVNLTGEALPPLFIFESKGQNDENFSIEMRVIYGLPEVTGKNGLERLTCTSSYIAVRSKFVGTGCIGNQNEWRDFGLGGT